MATLLDRMTKLHSRLRCVANGKTDVNAVRAQQNGAVRVAKTNVAPPVASSSGEVATTRAQRQRRLRGTRIRSKQKALASDVEVNVFVLLSREDTSGKELLSRRSGRVGTATTTLAGLKKFEEEEGVQLVELAETLRAPDPKVEATVGAAPREGRHRHLQERSIDLPGNPPVALDEVGADVLVGIIDVGGLDFAHPDFLRDDGRSRVIAIWDQGGTAFPAPRLTGGPSGGGRAARAYGSEITEEDIGIALAESAAAGVSPYDLAPQSQQLRGSHATHVASIAAGRSGVCPRASIAAVMISLPDSDRDRRKSFYDTTSIADALTYLFDLADRRGFRAISVNISLGTNGGAHDGSELMSRWIDSALAQPGRAICVAAGNSGQEVPQFEGDTGFWSGRVHASGRIPAASLRKDLEWVVVGNGLEDVSENELEIWYGAEDEFAVELFTPKGVRIGPLGPGQRIENLMLADRTVVSIYNVLSDPKNGDNRISLYLSPFLGNPVVGVAPGVWKVRLTGKVIRNGRFNAWIERDDPGRVGASAQWRLPSFFGPNSFVDNSTLSSLACGPRVIGVANLDEAREMLNASSSQGPTRDGRMKPEIAAPGTKIPAACGFHPTSQWIEMTGTSMASPYVAGVAALMLSLNPELTAAQIGGIIRRTSNPLPGASFEWQNGTGFGVIDAAACMREAVRISRPTEDLTARWSA